jgi:hypothetical protein
VVVLDCRINLPLLARGSDLYRGKNLKLAVLAIFLPRFYPHLRTKSSLEGSVISKMAAIHLGPGSARLGYASRTIGRRSTCVCRQTLLASRQAQQKPLVFSRRAFSQQPPKRPTPESKIQWYPIPVGLGVGFLGLVQFYKVYTREQEKDKAAEDDGEPGTHPKNRRRIRPDGPWYDSSHRTISP